MGDENDINQSLTEDVPPSHILDNQTSMQDTRALSKGITARETILRRLFLKRPILNSSFQGKILVGIELLAVFLWTLYITHPYLDLDPTVVPSGREFLSAIQMNHLWPWARECGVCALWYGGVRGGIPAFADPLASVLHPLVILTTLGWGVVNGSKLALVGFFLVAGLAQLWLGYVLGLKRVARVWSAVMAVASGHLAARMNLGAFGLIASTATAGLVFPAVISLARSGSRKALVVLGATLALVAVSGTGYIQIGIALVFPAAVLLIPWERIKLSRLIRHFVIAIGLAILLAGPFMVSFVHFLPQFVKDFDVSFSSAQPFAYVPLNLVIRDTSFFLSDVLGKQPWPSHYVNFIGWVPVLLAVWGLFGIRNREEKRVVIFLGAAALIALWISSGTPLVWLVKFVKLQWLSQLIGGLRYTAFIAGLAIPPILALAAIGLDQLIDSCRRRFNLSMEDGGSALFRVKLDPRWLLAIPLILAMNQARTFGSQWIQILKIDPYVTRVIEALQTPDLQWVNVPLGEHFFVEPAVGRGLKLSADFFRTWHWKDRPLPEPVMEANHHGPPEGMTEARIVDGIHIHIATQGREYAAVEHLDGSRTICTALGLGGKIDVACDTIKDGLLVVRENNWSGWRAKIDGVSVPLQPEKWLSVEAPVGDHNYSFRYLPFDVFLGVAFLVVGVFVAGWLWWRSDEQTEAEAQTDPGKYKPN